MQFDHLKRREFIALLGGAAVARPGAAISQPAQPARRIGVLMSTSEGDAEVHPYLLTFQKALQDLGWTQDRNVQIDYRFVVSDPDRIRTAAAELLRVKPDVMVAQSTPEVRALLELTRMVPIVSPMIADPVGSGLVKSFARPGGNVTGFTNFEEGMGGKWLGLLKATAPDVSNVALVLHPNDEELSGGLRSSVETAASATGVGLTLIRDAHIERALDGFARDSFARKVNSGLIVLPGIYTGVYRYSILALAARYRWPAVYPFREWVVSGGLMSYGTDIAAAFRQTAVYVDRILQGARPGDLPIQAPTKFQLVISLWAAKALELTIPPSLLAIADEVIE